MPIVMYQSDRQIIKGLEQGLVLDDLKGSWGNNRKKVRNKCDVLESSWNHPYHPVLSSIELVPGAKNIGDCWSRRRIQQLRIFSPNPPDYERVVEISLCILPNYLNPFTDPIVTKRSFNSRQNCSSSLHQCHQKHQEMFGYKRPLRTQWVKKKKEPTFREI